MGLFWGRKKTRHNEKQVDIEASVEVERIKKQTLDTAEYAHERAKELHSILTANNISVQIHRATGGRHGH